MCDRPRCGTHVQERTTCLPRGGRVLRRVPCPVRGACAGVRGTGVRGTGVAPQLDQTIGSYDLVRCPGQTLDPSHVEKNCR